MDLNADSTAKTPAFDLRSEIKSALPHLFSRHLVSTKTPKEQRFGLIKELSTLLSSKGYTCQSMPINYWEGGVKREGRLDLVISLDQKPLVALVISREFTSAHLLKLQAAFAMRMLPMAVGLESGQYSIVQSLAAELKTTKKFPWWLLTCAPYPSRKKADSTQKTQSRRTP